MPADTSSAPQQPNLVPQQQQKQQQQQGQQQVHPPGYDPSAAAGFMPLPGDKPFWYAGIGTQHISNPLDLQKHCDST